MLAERATEPIRSEVTLLLAQQLTFMLLLLPAGAGVLIAVFAAIASFTAFDSSVPNELAWSIGWGAVAAGFIACVVYAARMMRAQRCRAAFLLLMPPIVFAGGLLMLL